MERNKCKNCESVLHGKFCSSCGQKVYTDKDKSISFLIQEAFHFITHFEGKFFTTLKTIYKHPGKLSLDYSNGIRQKYYKPVSFYFLIVLLYLLYPVAEGMTMKMKSYKENSFIGSYMSQQIMDKMIQDNISEEQLSDKFRDKSKSVSKFLLLLLIPLSVPILYLLYFNKNRNLFDNFILMTEINIFFLLTFYIFTPILFFPILYYFDIVRADDILAPLLIIVLSIYSFVLFRNVFKERLWVSVSKAVVFVLLFMIMIIAIYRLIVFETTFALI